MKLYTQLAVVVPQNGTGQLRQQLCLFLPYALTRYRRNTALAYLLKSSLTARRAKKPIGQYIPINIIPEVAGQLGQNAGHCGEQIPPGGNSAGRQKRNTDGIGEALPVYSAVDTRTCECIQPLTGKVDGL